MAKLCRIHFAGMGNVSARFNPLTLDFRGEGSIPAHSVLWLRNGGGKTTMLSLFYSVILPAKREWLGKFHEKPTELGHYMFDKELGYILIEFSFADGTRRIIGQSLIKRSAQEVSRICFTMRSDGRTPLESLPVIGLSAEPAKTREAFFAFLDAENRKDPRGVELVKFDLSQTSLTGWERHLVEIGVDPAVYRSHLVMNSDEGGLGAFFDFKTSDKFIERLLEMADDPNVIPDDATATDQTEAVVDKFRTKVLEQPDLDKEARFCQLVADGTQQYRLASHAAAAAAVDLQKARIEAAKALRSVQTCVEECKVRIESIELRRKMHASDRQEAENAQTSLRRYKQNYDRQGVTLRHAEAQSALNRCQSADALARHDLALIKGAEKLRGLDYWVELVKTHRAALEALQAHRKPEMDEVSNLGTTLWHLLNESVTAVLNGIEELKRQLDGNKAELAQLVKDLTGFRDRLAKHNRELTSVRQSINYADRERRGLRESGVLTDGETAPEAQARLRAEISRLLAQIAQATEDFRTFRSRAQGYREEAKGHRAAAAKEAQGASVANTKLHEAGTVETVLRANRHVQKHGGKDADLYNPGLMQAIQNEADAIHRDVVARVVSRASDERILARHAPPGRPTFPVPIAVERVLELLRSKGVRSAISRYEWINANFGLGEAETLLKSNPAAGAGILVQDPSELNQAISVTTADGIDSPVAISVLSAENSLVTTSHVVLPAERGYFNAAAAAASRGLVQERVHSSEREQLRLDASRKDVEKAANTLSDYVHKYPVGVVAGWKAEVDAHKANETALLAQAGQADTLAVANEEQANEAQQRGSHLQATRSGLEQQELQVSKYITDYHNRLDGWKQVEITAMDGIKDAERDIQQADDRTEVLTGNNESINQTLQGRYGEVEVLKQRRDKVPASYRHGIVETREQDISALEGLFQVKMGTLENVINESGLPQSIKMAENGVQKEQSEYDRFLLAHRLRDPDVRAASELHPDIQEALATHQQTANSAGQALTLADSEARQAKLLWSALPPLTRDQRATVHPDMGDATTRAQAEEYARRCQQLDDEKVVIVRESLREEGLLKDQAAEVRELSQVLKNWPEELERVSGGITSTEGHARFEANLQVGDTLKGIRAEVNSQWSRHRDAQEKANTVFNDRIQSVLTHADFLAAKMNIRDRLIEMTGVRSQFDTQLDDIVAAIKERISVIEHSQSELESQRTIVLQAMESRGSAAITMLRSAQRLSVMPPEIPAWSGQSFMKFSVPEKRDDVERKSYLRRLLQYWIETKVAIPRGHVMAFECLMALVGSLDGGGKPAPKGAIGVEILKPEANLKLYYHDILVMRTFSGGELVTTAIILYCVLARLRAKRRGADTHTLNKDSGFLLLDNPVGKANLPDFLDLQIRIADILGVQYICGTGINDIEALGAFPKVIRMRNSTINPRTGANIVQVTKETVNPVSAIQVAAKTPVLARKTGTPEA